MDGSLKLGMESYFNMLGMMRSPDEENKIVALNCLENMDFKTNLVYILMLMKHTSIEENLWKCHAPITFDRLFQLNFKLSHTMTFKKVFETVLRTSVHNDDIQFFFDIFSGHLKEMVQELGYDALDNIEIKLIHKKDVTNKNRSARKSK